MSGRRWSQAQWLTYHSSSLFLAKVVGVSAEAVVETTKAVAVAETIAESVVSETQAQAMSIAEAIAPDSHCGSGSDGGNGWGSNDRWGVVDGHGRSGHSHGCGVNDGAGHGDRSSVNNGAGHGDRSSVNNGAGNGHYGAGNGDGSGDGVDYGPSDRYWSGNHGGRMVDDGSRGVVDNGGRGGGDGSSKDVAKASVAIAKTVAETVTVAIAESVAEAIVSNAVADTVAEAMAVAEAVATDVSPTHHPQYSITSRVVIIQPETGDGPTDDDFSWKELAMGPQLTSMIVLATLESRDQMCLSSTVAWAVAYIHPGIRHYSQSEAEFQTPEPNVELVAVGKPEHDEPRACSENPFSSTSLVGARPKLPYTLSNKMADAQMEREENAQLGELSVSGTAYVITVVVSFAASLRERRVPLTEGASSKCHHTERIPSREAVSPSK
ncbi:hypothetical protein HPB51_009917 [Rhipicephalus microplus]|uniref:Uncharacterized protein n=1 Tax=Rhipicephalus microplus TaxID=6941 RepID=A0A9J6ESW1_RHIMP|nr:hypothetical protein HPB51_009917 [Rhipicephalus microplus]